ncbi:MAG: helix-turn-helix domain-containing protein [Hyphomonas sp.]|jgi:DNA-binding transcriptional MerR regulator|nr:helix-turn-helix domain-containing protein [Hyphomonas sp.]
MLHLPIGEVARRTKLKIPTIRFYEEIGLLPAPRRAPNGRRVYGETEISRLAFIQNARQLGFGLDQIRALLDLSSRPASTCEDARTIAQDNLQIVKLRIAALRSLERELQQILVSCEGGVARDCRIIEALAKL